MGGFPVGFGAVAPLLILLEISPGCRGWFLTACLGCREEQVLLGFRLFFF